MKTTRFLTPESILGQIDPANTMTLTGLLLSLLSMMLSIQGQFNGAIVCLIGAGVVDLFDGWVARRIARTSLQASVGQQLDSLVDVCSFGISPALFAYCAGLQATGSLLVLTLYVMATALRLAYFNSVGLSGESASEAFTGLPVTYAALFIPVVYSLHFLVGSELIQMILTVLYGLLAIAMVSPFKVRKLKGVWYGVFSLGAIVLSGVYVWGAIVGI